MVVMRQIICAWLAGVAILTSMTTRQVLIQKQKGKRRCFIRASNDGMSILFGLTMGLKLLA